MRRCTALLLAVLAASIFVGVSGAVTASHGAASALPEPKLTGISSKGGAAQALATAAGIKAAKAAGPRVKLPANRTVSFLQVVGGIQSADRVANATQLALSQVGYKMLYCDGQGDPTKMLTCANTVLGQGGAAVFTVGIEPSVVAGPLRKAKAKGLPWLNVAGATGPGYTGSYGPDEAKLGATLGKFIIAKLNALPGSTQKMAIEDFPLSSIHLRTVAFKALLKSQPKIKVAAEVTGDFANAIQGTQQQVTTILTQNPDLKAIYFGFDTAGQAGGQQVQSMYPGKQFPSRPLVATFHADPATNDLLRSGAVDVAADVAYDISCWVAVDQFLEHVARGKPIKQGLDPRYPFAPDLYSYKIVTKANVPPAGHYVNPDFDVVSYFKAKWKAEFGK